MNQKEVIGDNICPSLENVEPQEISFFLFHIYLKEGFCVLVLLPDIIRKYWYRARWRTYPFYVWQRNIRNTVLTFMINFNNLFFIKLVHMDVYFDILHICIDNIEFTQKIYRYISKFILKNHMFTGQTLFKYLNCFLHIKCFPTFRFLVAWAYLCFGHSKLGMPTQ